MIRNLIRRKNFDPSRALDSDIFVPCPDGLKFDGYQKAAIAYALIRKDTLIADDPGLGKTVEAIGVVNILPAPRRVLVICPSFLKPHWRRMFQLWSSHRLTVEYVKDGKSGLPATDVVVINYELLEKYYDQLRQINWDFRIIDEVHKLKNKKADRTLQVFGGIKRNSDKKIIARYSPIPGNKSVYLTGTPSLNGKPKELWNLIQQIDPEGLGADWFSFAKRYCQLVELFKFDPTKGKPVHSGWKWDGADNLEELQQRMRQSFMVRRLKSEVMKDLPAKRRMILPIESNSRLQKQLQKELEDFDNYAKNKGEDVYLELPAFTDFSKRMREQGLSMVKPAIEVIESDLEEHEKIVVMCFHKDVAKQIAAAFKNSVLIDGDVAPSKRQELVDQFQQDDKTNLAVCTIGAASEGFDMTRARLMIFPERDWTPGKVTQAEDRIHRRGQTRGVLYKHLVREGSLAERQVKILVDKQEKSDMMLDREA